MTIAQPDPPTITGGVGSMDVAWTAPAADVDIDNYIIHAYTSDDAFTTRYAVGATSNLHMVVTSVNNLDVLAAKQYKFTVVAFHHENLPDAQDSAESARSAPGSPSSDPPTPFIGAATDVTATVDTSTGTLNVSWTPATDSVTGVALWVFGLDDPDPGQSVLGGIGNTQDLVSNTWGMSYVNAITPGDHTISVRGVGSGPHGDVIGEWASSGTFTIPPLPLHINAPTGVSATAGDGVAYVSWTAPSVQDVPVESYYVTDSSETSFWPQNDPIQNSLQIDGLPNGTAIRFKVRGDGTNPDDSSTLMGEYSDLTDWVTPTSPAGPIILGTQMPSHGNTGWDTPLLEVLETIETRLASAVGTFVGSDEPTAVANSGAGSGVGAPVVLSGATTLRGTVTFGTGIGSAPGPLVDITFPTPLDVVPVVVVSSNKLGTVPFATNISIAGFSIGVPYPTDDLMNDAYSVSWVVLT